MFTLCKEVSAASESFETHKDCTDGLNVIHVANDFFAGNDHRKHVFSNDVNRLINYVLTYSSFPQILSNHSNSCYSIYNYVWPALRETEIFQEFILQHSTRETS